MSDDDLATGDAAEDGTTATDRAWQDDWLPLVAVIGRQLGGTSVAFGADVVERGSIRRYLEPLELGSALHHDAAVARAHGYPDVIAPYTQAMSYAVATMWQPGDATLYVSADPDAQPARSPINNEDLPLGPRTTGFFATDIEVEFVRPLVVGERVGRRGRTLLACSPKETSVGRGAFLTWESELVTDSGDVVAYVRTGTYAYNPHQEPT